MSPVNQIPRRLLFGVVGEPGEMRRSVGKQELVVAKGQQTREGRFDRVGEMAFCRVFGQQSLRQRRRAGAKSIDFDPRIFGFEGAGNLFVLLGGQGGVPDDLALAFRALEQNTLTVASRIGSEFGRGQWLAALAPCKRREKAKQENRDEAHRRMGSLRADGPSCGGVRSSARAARLF